jgi:hypothetical protein
MRFLLGLVMGLFFVASSSLYSGAYGQFSSLESQFPSPTGKKLIKIETLNYLNNLELAPTKDKVIIKEKGVYLILASFQVGSLTGETSGYLDFWFVKNGKQVPNSGNRITSHSSGEVNGFLLQIIEPMEPGDTIGMGFFASSPSLGILFFNPDNEPAMTSAMVSVVKLGN